MWQERKIQLFKLISGSDEFAVVLMDDLVSHLNMKKNTENSSIVEKFLTSVLAECVDVSVSTKTLNEHHNIKENDIT